MYAFLCIIQPRDDRVRWGSQLNMYVVLMSFVKYVCLSMLTLACYRRSSTQDSGCAAPITERLFYSCCANNKTWCQAQDLSTTRLNDAVKLWHWYVQCRTTRMFLLSCFVGGTKRRVTPSACSHDHQLGRHAWAKQAAEQKSQRIMLQTSNKQCELRLLIIMDNDSHLIGRTDWLYREQLPKLLLARTTFQLQHCWITSCCCSRCKQD